VESAVSKYRWGTKLHGSILIDMGRDEGLGSYLGDCGADRGHPLSDLATASGYTLSLPGCVSGEQQGGAAEILSRIEVEYGN
jgi:hypothetical protein